MEASLPAPTSGHAWRFSLKHLLIALGVASVVLSPAAYFGIPYLISITLSLALVALCVSAYRATAVVAVVIALFSLFFAFFLAIFLLPFSVHALFNVLVCLALALARVRTRTFAIGLVLTVVAVYGLMIGSAISEVRELIALKASTPFQSLDARLAFEDRLPPAASSTAGPIRLAAAVANDLLEQDNNFDSPFRSRSWLLQQLHENTAEQFARAAGFGFARMPSVRASVVKLPPRTPLKLPQTVFLQGLATSTESMRSLHQRAVGNFVDSERAAYARSRQEVSGFEPHGLSSLESYACGCNKTPQPEWQVVRLELVSLLRHETPCVYTAESLPEMDKLANVPQRPLNDFEQKSLPQLATQEDVVVNQQAARIEMLGALRAGKTCLECHHGERGQLLGAFSYELKPLVTSAEKSTKARVQE